MILAINEDPNTPSSTSVTSASWVLALRGNVPKLAKIVRARG